MSFIMYLPDGSYTNDIEDFVEVYSDKFFRDYPQNTQEK